MTKAQQMRGISLNNVPAYRQLLTELSTPAENTNKEPQGSFLVSGGHPSTLFPVQRLLIIAGFLALFLAPAGASALEIHTYDLRPGLINARFEGKGAIAMRQETNGVLLTTGDGTGMLVTDTLPSFFAEAATVLVSSASPSEFRFLWMQDTETFSSIPLSVAAGNQDPMSFGLRTHPEWKKPMRFIGLMLPPHTEILVSRIDLVRWSILEKVGYAIQSLFLFDEYRPYSINFVWGPLIARNPMELRSAFQNLPPQEVYATYALNIALVITLAALLVFARARRRDARFVFRTFALIVLGAWLLLDLRMGAEFLSWVHHDRTSYISAPASSRQFRDRGQFYDFAAFVKPYLHDRTSYVFFAQQAWPYLGNMRYLTYPSIPGIDIAADDTWVIFDRPDMTVSDAGQVTIDGEAVSAPGEILARFDDTSFVFRTLQTPTAP